MRAAISCMLLALSLATASTQAQPNPIPAAPPQPATPPVAESVNPSEAQSVGRATAPAAGQTVVPSATEPSAATESNAASACGAVQFADEVIMGVSRTQLCPKPVDPTLELLSAKLERAPSKSTTLFFEVLRELREHLNAQTESAPRERQEQAAAAARGQHAAAHARDEHAAGKAREQQVGPRERQEQAAPEQQLAPAARERQVAATEPQGGADAAAESGTPPALSDWRIALAAAIDEAFAQAKAEQHPSAAFAAVRGIAADLDPDACLFMTGDAGQPDYACYVLEGKPEPQPLTPASMHVYELTSFEDAYLAQRALAITYSALVKLDLRSLDVAIKRLTQAEQRWNSLRKRGYLQYPWELALSSVLASYRDYQACFAVDAFCTGEEGLDPERTRLIALHPGVGMGFSGFGRNPKPSADAALALSLELIGLTHYTDDFETYFGASLGAVVNDGDFRDVRPGVFVHLTRWLHVGYLVSLFRNASRYDATLFVSSDLGTAFGADFFE